MQHLHIISFDIPYPADYGGVIDVFYKIQAFYEAGIKIHLHCFAYGRKQSAELVKYCESVTYYERFLNFKYLFSAKPYIVATRSNEQLLKNLLIDDYPILFEGLHTTFILSDDRLKNRLKIVRTHNIEHEYYNQLSNYQTFFKKEKYFFKLESIKLKLYEPILKHANIIAAISPNDYSYFQKKYNKTIYVPAFHPYKKMNCKTGFGKYALYHGNLSVSENVEAVLFLINHVFNNLDIPFLITGKNPTNEIINSVSKHSTVYLKANPSDEEMNQLLTNAHINILPTFQKTGIKLKLLAALYNGRHCLVNNEMVENTGLENLCLVKNSADEMKSEINQLFKISFEIQIIEKRKKVLEEKFLNMINIQKLINCI